MNKNSSYSLMINQKNIYTEKNVDWVAEYYGRQKIKMVRLNSLSH